MIGMGVEVHVAYEKELVPDTQGAHPEAGQEQTAASDHPFAGLPAGRISCGGSWPVTVFCLWGTHGNAGM